MKEYLQDLFMQLLSNSVVSDEPTQEVLSDIELQDLFDDMEYQEDMTEYYREKHLETKNKLITALLDATGIDFEKQCKDMDFIDSIKFNKSALIKLPSSILELKYSHGGYSIKHVDYRTPEEWRYENKAD